MFFKDVLKTNHVNEPNVESSKMENEVPDDYLDNLLDDSNDPKNDDDFGEPV